MTQLEERIRRGLGETAERIPDSAVSHSPIEPRRPIGALVGIGAALAVLLLFVPLAFILGPNGTSPANQGPVRESEVVPARVGFEFASPEHVRLQFSQDLILECQDLETIDDGGFDSFELDIWIDHRSGFTRLGFDYPNGSSYDLILEGRPGEWEYAWGSGADMGRDAGCRESLGGESYQQSVVGWAFQDSSELWFTAYTKPAFMDETGIFIYHDDSLTNATSTDDGTYLIENSSPEGGISRFQFTLDGDELRVLGESRYVYAPDRFEARATIEVLESGPANLPADIFDTSDFTPLWGDPGVVTTAVNP